MRPTAAWASLLLTAVLLVPAPPVAARLVNTVVAAVDGKPLTLRELLAYEKGGARLLVPEEKANRRTILKAMIVARLFEAEFERYGMEADDDDVTRYIENILDQRQTSREEITAALNRLGLEWDDYFERMRNEVRKLALANREVRSRLSVTPEEIERNWLADPSYQRPPSVEIGHIYMSLPTDGQDEVRARAREAYRLARKGEFETVAAEYSEGPSSGEGGYLGIFPIGSLAPHFEEAVAALKEGGVSKPFEADGAIHLLRLIRRSGAGRVPLEEVSDGIRESLYDQRLSERFKRWVEEDLPRRHHVVNMLDQVSELGGT